MTNKPQTRAEVLARFNELDKLRTPGKYKVVAGKKFDELFIEADTRTGGRICRIWNGRTSIMENAKFIASAPDILALANHQAAVIEAMQEALEAANGMSDWFMEHSRQADHAHSGLDEKLEETKGWKELIDAGYNGLVASYRDQFTTAITLANAPYGDGK